MVAKKNQTRGTLKPPPPGVEPEVIHVGDGRVNPSKPSEPTDEPQNEPRGEVPVRRRKKKSSKKS